MAQTPPRFGVGTPVTIEATISRAGTPVDPTGVICRLTKPDGTSTDLTMTSTEVGVWTVDHVTDQTGGYKARVLASGAYVGVTVPEEFVTE